MSINHTASGIWFHKWREGGRGGRLVGGAFLGGRSVVAIFHEAAGLLDAPGTVGPNFFERLCRRPEQRQQTAVAHHAG